MEPLVQSASVPRGEGSQLPPASRCTVYTLIVGDYAPRITHLTLPLMKAYARKIGAEFRVLTERKFPDFPPVYEKLQIHTLGAGSEWNIFIDADALVSPEMFDPTNHLGKDTVCHNGKDFAGIRWQYDEYFRRDGRHFGSCNWFTVGSHWCLDLWRPLDDISMEEAFRRINITNGEFASGCCKREHLIDDYTLSRNIARFGLKATTLVDICAGLGMRLPDGRGINPYLFHMYNMPEDEKLRKMLEILSTPPSFEPGKPNGWGIMHPDEAQELRRKWGI